MMRWVIFSVVVVVLAAIATVGSTFLSTATPLNTISTAQDKPNGPSGLAFVDAALLHEFGSMAQQTEGNYEWTIVNKGLGNLLLEKGESTCSCTIANLENGTTATIEPGQSTKVKLNWNTKGNNGKFSQRATILVKNDPEHQKLDFSVAGLVHPPILTMPPELMIEFRDLPNDKPSPREIVLYSIDRPDTKFTDATASNPSLFEAAILPLTPDEMKQLRANNVAKGSKLFVKIKPGASIGAFAEELIVSTDHPKKPKLTLQVSGKLTGPITVTPDRVRLLDVSSKLGDTQTLTVWVRGEKTTKFTIDKKPKNFDVQISPMSLPGAQNAARYQLTVKVPAGTPAGMIADEIIIKTDHPNASEVKIPVAVLVRAS